MRAPAFTDHDAIQLGMAASGQKVTPEHVPSAQLPDAGIRAAAIGTPYALGIAHP
jgi:hypothetical protein